MFSFKMTKKLLALDINGILCYKHFIKDKSPINNVSNSEELAVGGFVVFLRPHARHFLSFCFDNYDIGFYSSTTRKNAQPILDVLLTDDQKKKVKFYWYRDRTRLDPDWKKKPDIKQYDTVKLIQDILDCPTINESRNYNAENVFLIDDSMKKTRFNDPKNVFIVKTFNPCDENEDEELLNLVYKLDV